MIERKGLLSYIQLVIHVVIPSGFILAFLSHSVSTEAVLYSIRPAAPKQYRLPFAPHYGMGYLNSDLHFKEKEPVYLNRAPLPRDNILQIEASDAVDTIKYSQPDIAYSLFNLNSGLKVPSSTFFKQKLLQTSAHNPSPENFQDHTFSTHHASENSMKPMRDIRYLDSIIDEGTKSGDLDFQVENNFKNVLQTQSYDQNTPNTYSQGKTNFTDSGDDIVYVSSDAVLSYEVPSSELNDSSDNSSVKQNFEIVGDVPSLNSSDILSSTFSPVTNTLSEYTTISSNTHVYIEFMNQTNWNNSIMSSSVFPSTNNNDSAASSLPSRDSEKNLSSGTVAGIVIAVLVSVTLLSSAVIYLLYRKFNGKCTSVVESKFNTDNCGYLDDSLRSSIYLNNHIELPKESSEEMTSLDNDSFLNSLETMTIQNYWADNSKNTKV